VKHLLQQAEGTEPTAREASDEAADDAQGAQDIETGLEFTGRQAETDGGNGMLQRADRAGPDGRRARVAVENRHADAFGLRLHDGAGEVVGHYGIEDDGAEDLHPSAPGQSGHDGPASG